MSYCVSCGIKLGKDDKFCQNCGIKITKSSIEKEILETKTSEKTHHNENVKRNVGKTIFNIILIFLIIIVLFLIVASGVIDKLFSGSGVPYVDPCERSFNDCNHDCGEGILNRICKEKCSYVFRSCKNGNR